MLSSEQIEKNRLKIIAELEATEREGMNELIKYLDNNGFFTQASSTKYHQSYRGGNAEHSIEVFDALDNMNVRLGLEIPQDSVSICSLLHDICKIDNYIENEDGTFRWNSLAESGHGMKSVRIISKFIKLSKEEEDAIVHHMGAYERKEFDWNDLSGAYRRDKLSFYIHVADMISTYGF